MIHVLKIVIGSNPRAANQYLLMSLRLNAQVRRLWAAIDKAIVGRDDCPMTRAALGELKRSVEVEFAADVAARGGGHSDGIKKRARRYYFATRRLTAKVK